MRRSFNQRRDYVWVVVSGAKRRRNISRPFGEVAPASLVTEFAVESFPAFRLFFRIEKRELGALNNWNVCTPSDFEQPKRPLRLLLHPLVAAHRGDAQYIELLRLKKNQD